MKTKAGVFLCLFLAGMLAVPSAFADGPPPHGGPGGGPGGFAPVGPGHYHGWGPGYYHGWGPGYYHGWGPGHYHGGGPGWWWTAPGPWYIGVSPFFFYPPFPAVTPIAPPPQVGAGPIWVLREGVDRNGNLCREFQQTVNAGGGPGEIHGIACRRPDGTWQIVGG